ncbi:hypothetical protein AX17_005208 [Amanita inopinata Kibby_2008]|nr:hypothetical protein AX17_005208 [Amanita inopinata Kibby_2008]
MPSAFISGGTDEVILKYDFTHSNVPLNGSSEYSPLERYTGHQDTIRGITCHRVLDEVVLTASEDGSVVRHDGRESAINNTRKRALNTLQLKTEVTGIEYHPHMDHLFVTSDNRGNVCLRDDRMAFGPSSRRSQLGVVQEYNTKLCRKSVGHLTNPESSSVTFDRDGSKLAVTMLHYYPTIYALSDPNPIALLTGHQSPAMPEGEYSNSCTMKVSPEYDSGFQYIYVFFTLQILQMKHGAFGGPGMESDDLYVAGSDDFRGYVWNIPPVSELVESRQIISASEWESDSWLNTNAYTRGMYETKCIPVEISRPFCRLTGHRSIVNTTAFHPSMLHVVTAGIERNIVLHSPTPSSPCTQNLRRTLTETRTLSEDGEVDRVAYYRALYGLPMLTLEQDDPDGATISMFDHILREEGEADVFSIRRWSCSGDSDDSSTDEVNMASDDSDDEIVVD